MLFVWYKKMWKPVKLLGSLMQSEWNPLSQTVQIMSSCSTSFRRQMLHFLQLGHSQWELSLMRLSSCGEQFKQLIACPDIPHSEQVISSLSLSPAVLHIPHLRGCGCGCFTDDFWTFGGLIRGSGVGSDMSSSDDWPDDEVRYVWATTELIVSSMLIREEVGFSSGFVLTAFSSDFCLIGLSSDLVLTIFSSSDSFLRFRAKKRNANNEEKNWRDERENWDTRERVLGIHRNWMTFASQAYYRYLRSSDRSLYLKALCSQTIEQNSWLCSR